MKFSRRFIGGWLSLAIALAASEATASQYSDAVLANTPVAYWRLDETSLPTATNIGTAGATVDATFHNLGTGSGPLNIGQVGPLPGDIAGSFTIDGLEAGNRAIHLAPVSPALMDLFPRAQVDESQGNALDITGTAPATGLTLEAWIRRDPQANAGNNEGIVSKFQGSTQFGNNRSYNLYYDPRSGGRVGFLLSTTGLNETQYDLKTPTDIPLDQWVHLAATYDPVGTRTAIYVNGQLAAEATSAVNVPGFIFDGSAPFWIGQQFSDDPSTTFEGRIDEVAVYDKPLSGAQIAAHFAAATSGTPVTINWSPNSSGSWHSAANWTTGAVPNANNVSVVFGTAITAAKVVYTESNVTAKSIRFDNNSKYAVAGIGTVTLSSNSGNASIQVARGAQEFQTPVTLASDTDVSVLTGSISFNNVLNLGGKTMHILSGTVNINNSVVPGAGGQITNGASLGAGGSINLGGDFSNTGTLNIEIGGTSPGEYSAFNFGGTATLAGFIDAELVDGFTLSSGDTFTVLTAGNLVNNGIALTGSLAESLTLNVVGNSLVLSAGLLGDFNNDGNVNGGDYSTWRKGLGSRFTPNDYELWRSNFGASSSLGSSLSAAVPEPSSLVLLLAAGLIACSRTRLQARPNRAQMSIDFARRIALGAAIWTILLSASTAQASPYSDAVLADGPVAYYRLGETSGSVAANSSIHGAALDGTYLNFGAGSSPSSTIGQVGPRPGDPSGSSAIQGFESDNIGIRSAANANAQVEVPDNNLLDITGALTLEAWVRRDDAQASNGNNEGIVGKFTGTASPTNQRSYDLYYNSRTGTGLPSIGFILNTTGVAGGNVDFSTAIDIPAGSTGGWAYLAAVYEPNVRMSVYLNGVSIGEKTTGLPAASLFAGTAPLWIGRQFSSATNTSFEGLIDEVAVYDKALSAAQVAAHYSAAANNTPANFSWAPNSSGGWETPGNWSPNTATVPNGALVSITFGSAITAPKVVYIESSITAKSVSFNNSNKYAIAGVGTLNLTANTGNASLQVVAGSHEFQTALSLGSNTDVNVTAGASNKLTINNALNLGGKTLNIQSGIVNVNHSVIAGTGGQIVNGAAAILGTAGSTSFGGNLINTGTLAVEIGGTGADQFSQFNVGGTATLSGFVSPSLVNGFMPTSGSTFTILTATNLINSGIAISGPLSGSMSLSVMGNSLVLTAGLGGDFNQDGKVNGADYVVWRKGLGTTYVQNDYNVWRSNFGAGGGSGASLGAAVPEPSSLALLLVVGSISLGTRRGFRR